MPQEAGPTAGATLHKYNSLLTTTTYTCQSRIDAIFGMKPHAGILHNDSIMPAGGAQPWQQRFTPVKCRSLNLL